MKTMPLTSFGLAMMLFAVAMAKTTYYLTGNAADSASTLVLGGPVLYLGGGGYDVDVAFQDVIDKIRGCTGAACATKIDVVILRTTGSDGYNPYLMLMNGVDSVQTYVLTTVTDANRADVETAIKNAEFVFFAGGDQCTYVNVFKGTKVETATEYAYARGAAIGGTSAGMAIMGQYTYNACSGSATSAAALANPYDKTITFTYGFFDFGYVAQTITDQHFVVRDRMGRLLAFLARQIKDGKTTTAWGIAANEETTAVVAKNGLVTVIRNDGVNGVDTPIPPASVNAVTHFILADHAPVRCVSRQSLSYTGYKVWKRTYGQTFDLANKPTTPDYTIDVVNGVITVNGNGGSVY
jgi:cyanophycinase